MEIKAAEAKAQSGANQTYKQASLGERTLPSNLFLQTTILFLAGLCLKETHTNQLLHLQALQVVNSFLPIYIKKKEIKMGVVLLMQMLYVWMTSMYIEACWRGSSLKPA